MRPTPRSSNLSTKHRIKLTVAYDGTDFCGWAPQTGQRTVHGTLTDGLRQVLGEEVELFGASRTDSGAHAIGQVCHVDVPTAIPVERWPRILNKLMPRDLTIRHAESVPSDFHSRFWARHRFYRYRILCGPADPLRSRYVHTFERPLDIARMQAAAQHLRGERDFRAYSQLLADHANSVRTILKSEVRQMRDEVWIEIAGTAFVRGMMRRISGALLEIGRGARETDYTARLFDKTFRSAMDWPPVLPASGLSLIKVSYGRHPSDHRKTI